MNSINKNEEKTDVKKNIETKIVFSIYKIEFNKL